MNLISSRHFKRRCVYLGISLAVMVVLVWSHGAVAQDTASIIDTDPKLKEILDTIWLVIAGFFIFFMNAGFCLLETGFCRKQNAINILAKNLVVFSIATVAFWLCGAGLMFGGNNSWIGTEGFFFSGQDIFNRSSGSDSMAMEEAQFFFQLVFAGTAATIVSGAVAERMRFLSFLIFSFLLVGFLYPITGHWAWSESGWLTDFAFGGSENLAFWDFAGSTVVHTVGGAAGLMGTIALGARADKYCDIEPSEFDKLEPRQKTKFKKKIEPLNGHNTTLATLG
ncbi:MAG: hypothetical protein F6K26_27275, partial [Moorea sp. SIO2I5]|nr:hypothetical protein [Moorena sp. SIO2I5]